MNWSRHISNIKEILHTKHINMANSDYYFFFRICFSIKYLIMFTGSKNLNLLSLVTIRTI